MIEVVVRPDLELGTWQGIGGAITEATAYNFFKLKPERQKDFLKAYYGENGLDYRWGRISIASNDFCLESFEFTKSKDLEDFSIERDERYVLPLLKKILSKKGLRLVASAWSPPSFMKTSRRLRFGGRLRLFQYGNYAKYLKKWLKSYEKEGIKVDYLVPQNEPFARQIWESCLYSFRAQRRLAYGYLADELADTETQILLWDHNKARLPKVAKKLVLRDRCARDEKVAGLCFHWYDGTCADEMWRVRQEYPDILMLSSEMCCGFSRYDAEKWQKDAKLYLFELFSDINCGASAWIDWNMLLDWKGGPSYCRNYVKSPVILNEAGDDFILTPIYDALKHFARMFPAGSEVVRCEIDSEKVATIARKVEEGYEVILANVSRKEREVLVKLGEKEEKLVLAEGEIKKVLFKK